MSAPLTRILGTLRLKSPVYVRSPDGQLSKAVVKYASGIIVKTNARTFQRATGWEANVPEGRDPHRLLVPTETLDAEYAAQAAGSFEVNRQRVNTKAAPAPA